MYATFYDRDFPADHDMDIIRERVAEVGPSMDEHRCLGFKAYLMSEHRVSSFYLWHDPVAMAKFFFGESGFADLVRNSGRPAVEHWLGVGIVAGPARNARARKASSRITELPTDLGPELAELAELGRRSDVHTAALVADPRTGGCCASSCGTPKYRPMKALSISRSCTCPSPKFTNSGG
jgi:hypothetical protein